MFIFLSMTILNSFYVKKMYGNVVKKANIRAQNPSADFMNAK